MSPLDPTPTTPAANRDHFRSHRPHRPLLLVTALAASTAGLAACGGGASNATSASQTTTVAAAFTIVATDNKFDGSSYTTKDQTFAIDYRNKGSVTHSLVVKDDSGKILSNRILVAPGRSGGFQTTLTPGTYRVVCDVPGHETTMHAKLTIG